MEEKQKINNVSIETNNINESFEDGELTVYPDSNIDSKYFSLNVLRIDHELLKDEDNIKQKLINVKRVNLRKGEDWEILEDGKVVLLLKGIRFTKPEKDFLRTLDGMKFLISGYKNGIKSVVKFKQEIKKLKNGNKIRRRKNKK